MDPRHARFVWLTSRHGAVPPEPLASWLADRSADPDAVVVGLIDTWADDPLPMATERPTATAVVATGVAEAALTQTLRLGADELVDLSEPQERWRRRLAYLGDLAAMRREAVRRRNTASAFRNRVRSAPPPATERPPILFVGAAGGDQLAIVDALVGWTVAAYAQSVNHARRHLETGIYAAVIITDVAAAEALEATLAPLVAVEGPGAPSFVVVSPRDATFSAEYAFAMGAHEVLERALPCDLLQRRRARAVQDAALRLDLREQTAFADARDVVSGRVDHGAFHAHLDGLLRTAPHPSAALVAVVLEGLDEVNREAGYAAGDRAIGAVGHALARGVRAVDLVGRLGGGAFGIWIEPASDADLEALASRLQQRVRVAVTGDAGPALTGRIGWARPEPGADALALGRRAKAHARRTLLRAAG